MSAWTILAATDSRKVEMLRHMSEHFVQPDPGLYWKVPVVLSLLAVAFILTLILARIEHKRTRDAGRPQPMRLYLHCLRNLGLGWWDIWHLWRLVRRLRLTHPAAMLISPALYEAAVARYARNNRSLWAGLSLARLSALKSTIFPPAEPSAAGVGEEADPRLTQGL